MKIYYIDRATGKKEQEQVFGEKAIAFFYGGSFLGSLLQGLVSKNPFFSHLYGYIQSQPCSKKKVAPFIEKYGVDASEFEKKIDEFTSFNDFFIRKLKKGVRPIDLKKNSAVIPADGRFLFYQNISTEKNFIVKGKSFDVSRFLKDEALAARYQNGSLILGRLCPVDYHRFHFPVSGIPGKARLINGYLYSVNPTAIKSNIEIFYENKRYLTEIETEEFGKVLFLDIGATVVGKVTQTYTPGTRVEKGDEKGYFSFGGSEVALLFEEGRIKIDRDLLESTESGLEVLCKVGQTIGISKHQSV